MKTFIMISWRNMWRQKRRSLVVIMSIGIGIFAMIASMSVMNGMNVQMVENTIRTALGHIAIHQKGFQNDMKIDYNFSPDRKIIQAIKNNKEITAYAPRVKIQGMVRSSESSQGVMIVGIDPKLERQVTRLYDYTSKKEGSEFLSGTDNDTILISKTMADKLDLLVGDKLVVMVQDKDNDITGIGLTIQGLYESPVDSFDKFFVFMGIKKLQEITGLGNNISEMTLITEDKEDVAPVKASLTKVINDKNLEILTWKEMAPNLVSAVQLFDTMMYIFFIIIFVTVIFSVANTLIMSIMERFHEIGVMKCIGTRPSRIFFMVVFEALNLGAVGLAAGTVFGLAVVAVAGHIGLDFSALLESARRLGTGSVIYPLIRAGDIIAFTIIVFLTTFIASLYPAYKAARIKPLDALNFI